LQELKRRPGHCCPINSLSHREYPEGHKRVRVRESKQDNCLISYPLILSFSRWEKGCAVYPQHVVFMSNWIKHLK
jgi:hypothetical protein